MNLKGKKVLIVIAPKEFRDEEYYEPKKVLEGYGAEVITCSLEQIATSSFKKTQEVDILLSEATADYDAIVFVGGMGASVYFNDKEAHDLVREFNDKGKIVAAICIAPSTLANAGILKGKKATCFPSAQNNLKEKGAEYTGEDVTIDGNIITANGPRVARQFGEEIAKKL